ncbi:hypothetical protein [Lentibacillus sediminis]|uniref:hypothetical protein n=1 Tax=Lentibacillus sediminis TaxID=1940529 RepID=UPI000C1BC9CB|nr:hypothetical protein [Lentibacillus sediminis]
MIEEPIPLIETSLSMIEDAPPLIETMLSMIEDAPPLIETSLSMIDGPLPPIEPPLLFNPRTISTELLTYCVQNLIIPSHKTPKYNYNFFKGLSPFGVESI